MIRVGGVGGKKRRKYTMKAPMCLLRYHMPRKNFYVSRKEEELEGEGGAGWRGKIQETDIVKKFVAPCRSKEKKKINKKKRGSKYKKLFPSRLEIAWAFGWCPKKKTILPIPRPSILILVIVDPQPRRSPFIVSSLDNTDRRYFLPPPSIWFFLDRFFLEEGSGFPRERRTRALAERQTVGCFKCISSRASFPPGKFRCWPWLSLFVKRRYSRCTSWTARPGWTSTLGQRVQLAPCGTLIPGMMGDGGGLHHLYLRLHVVLDADEVRCRDLGSMVWNLHGWHMRDLNVEGLGVWGWNSRLLRNLEHLVDFRCVYLRNFSPCWINFRSGYSEKFVSLFEDRLLRTEARAWWIINVEERSG